MKNNDVKKKYSFKNLNKSFLKGHLFHGKKTKHESWFSSKHF